MPNQKKEMSSGAAGIDYFNRGHFLSRFQARVSLKVRKRVLDLALDYFSERKCEVQTVLDVGATPDTSLADSNCMIPWLRDYGKSISLWSIEDLTPIKETYSYCQFLPQQSLHDIGRINQAGFDLVIANAVIEHVGGAIAQKTFISDCASLGKMLLITTPNRGHWMEFHTKLPLLHWLPRSWHRKILNVFGFRFWAKEENLNLLFKSELLELADSALRPHFKFDILEVKKFGMTSNLILVACHQSLKSDSSAVQSPV